MSETLWLHNRGTSWRHKQAKEQTKKQTKAPATTKTNTNKKKQTRTTEQKRQGDQLVSSATSVTSRMVHCIIHDIIIGIGMAVKPKNQADRTKAAHELQLSDHHATKTSHWRRLFDRHTQQQQERASNKTGDKAKGTNN